MEILQEMIKIGGPSAIALIILYLIVKEFNLTVKEFIDFLKNHIQHNSSILKEVSERTKHDTEATKENTKVLRNVEQTLLRLNGFSKKK